MHSQEHARLRCQVYTKNANEYLCIVPVEIDFDAEDNLKWTWFTAVSVSFGARNWDNRTKNW